MTEESFVSHALFVFRKESLRLLKEYVRPFVILELKSPKKAARF